ncbi:hypothetical protein PaeCFBP13512_19710 [Paenibacillus sp. CFBP13512]|uniref:hypothetical protein n=1 Tax=Paenibacillus sp. CFBP13512 TaxID=2184007 RepID=UPI0010C0F90C|nr:hypothetical protein [Paenibacillus sp. CFBP13512]TKJ86063.1 hypothetical protein PaeCFBP13512_19710 [Paenibacillus sp. CFBP13512]
MNKESFFTMQYDKRAEEVNKLLQSLSLEDVAKKVGVNYSTFTKEMQAGDYVFIKRDNCYYKFLRDPFSAPEKKQNELNSEELNFLKENIEELRELIANSNDKSILHLDPRIYSKNSPFSVKSIKMNEDIYGMFTSHCEENFPHFRLQDLVAQSLLDFIAKY